MDDNFSSGNNFGSSSGQGPSLPPSGPVFGSGGAGSGGLKIGIIVLVVSLGIAGYYIQSALKGGKFQDLANQVNSVAKTISKTLDEPVSSNSNDQNSANSSSIASNQDNSEENLTTKLNAYVALLNYVSDNTLSSFSRYGQWVEDLDKGPTGEERNVYGIYQLNDYSNYFQEAQKAYELKPQIDLDKDFLPYQSAYLKLKPLADQAYTYYDQEDYRDDNFAEGKKLHTPLVAAFKAFEAISSKFDQDYEVLDVSQRQKEIAQYQKEGRLIAYNAASALYLSQQIYISVREQMLKNGNDESKLDVKDLQSKTEQFDALLTALKDQKNNLEELQKEYGNTGEALFGSFLRTCDDYLKSAKALYRGVRDKNLPEHDNFSYTTDGTPENLIYTYNQMVDAFNLMNRF